MQEPLVSVNMTAYNVEKYIAESIESILMQTYQNWELIIINDGSSDNTLQIAQNYAQNDKRIKVYDNVQNEGIVYSRNRAVHYSQGKYIAVLDSDDIALSQRLTKQVQFLEHNPDYGLVGSNAFIINSNGETIGKAELQAQDIFFQSILLINNFFVHSSVTMHTNLAKTFLYKPLIKGCSPGEEYQLFVNIAKHTKLTNLNEFLVKYREIDTGISKVRKDKIEEYVKKIILNQLSDLKIFPDEKTFELHHSIHTVGGGLLYNQILSYYKWMIFLVKQNNRYQIITDLEKYLAFRFYQICKYNAHYGIQLYLLFINRKLSKWVSKEDKLFLKKRCIYEQRKKWRLAR